MAMMVPGLARALIHWIEAQSDQFQSISHRGIIQRPMIYYAQKLPRQTNAAPSKEWISCCCAKDPEVIMPPCCRDSTFLNDHQMINRTIAAAPMAPHDAL